MTFQAFQRLQRVAELGPRFMSYLDEGSGPGEPVVLLHGMPTWGYLWHGLAAQLARTRRVLVPDLLGFGCSDKGDRFDRSLARQAEAIDRWLGQLGVARAAFVGHDIGGGVALRLAAVPSGRVSRLCLVNSVSYDSWPAELMLQLGHPEARRILSAATLARMLRRALLRGFAVRPPDELLDGLIAPYETEVGKVSLIRNAAALDTNLTTELRPSALDVPVLILWGEDDRFQPVRYAERLHWDIPGSRLIRLHGASHFAMIDRAAEVAAEVSGFLDARPSAHVSAEATI